MRSRLDWQPAQHGVMVYTPATRVSVEDTQQSMSRLSFLEDASSDKGVRAQQAQMSDTRLPSCEIRSETQTKTEPVELSGFAFSREDSTDTLTYDDDDLLAEAMSTAMSTLESSASTDLLAQLITAATGECLSPNTVPAESPSSETPKFIEDYSNETSPSPSERKTQHKRTSATGKTSHHFQRKTQLLTRKPLARRLDFGVIRREQAAKVVKRSLNAQALEELRKIERSPSHRWDDDERELLCILNRWYCGASRAAELTVFSKTFNAITGLDLKPRILRSQFESHLRLYGAAAFPVFGRVFAVPFDDPEGRYAQIRTLIEQEAQTLQLDLRRRHSDACIPSGMAKYAKSPLTRSTYEFLVRKKSQEARQEAGRVSATECVSTIPRSIVNTSMPVQFLPKEDEEVIADIEPSPPSVRQGPAVREARPHLAFRVWDTANRTKFIDGNFVADAFLAWPRPFPSPIALDDASECGKILAVLHLSKRGDTPVFISTASSLLQALAYATCMQQPNIALINLDAPSLQEQHKLHHAADVFSWLKSQGLARWARYKGNGEYFVWAEIPGDAVLHTIDLWQLIDFLNDDEDCQQLLSFEAFEPGIKTNALAAALREKNAILNTTNVRALGKTAKMFGMNKGNVTLLHIEDFVARIIDGWTITKADVIDTHTLSTLAYTFASALGTHAAGHTVQAVMGAFIEGVDQGTRCIAHWSKSRSGSRRQRFRQG